MRVFQSYRYPNLLVVVKLKSGPEVLAKFTDGRYIPPDEHVEYAMIMHPAHEDMFYSEIILQDGKSYPRDIRITYSNLNGILDTVVPYFQVTPYAYAQAVLMMTDIHKVDGIARLQADGKKSVVVQHGFRASRNYMDYRENMPYRGETLKILESQGRLLSEKKRQRSMIANEFISDLFCAWSHQDKRDMVKNGVSGKKIAVVGCPVLGEKGERVDPTGRRVLFVPRRGFVDMNDYENELIYEELRRIKNIDLKVKPKNLGDAEYYDPKHVINSDRHLQTHIPMVDEMIDWLDVVVETKFSTFSMKAIHRGKEAIDMKYCAKPVESLKSLIRDSLRPGQQFINRDSFALYSRFSGWREGDPASNIYQAVKKLIQEEK